MNFILCAFFLTFSFSTVAKKFATSYVSFDLLNNWHCHPEGTEWICKNKLNRKKASEAMIILTAKQKGPSDSLGLYINHLKSPRTVKASKRGEGFTSKVFHAKQRQINRHIWADGFHQGSEVPSYYTRYLVTIKGNLAVLVTYSAHKDHYKKYASDFSASINSLRVMNVSADFAGRKGSMGMGSVQDYLQDMIDADTELGADGGEGGPDDKDGLMGLLSQPEALGGLALGGGGLAYYFLKRRRKRQASEATGGREGRSSSRRSGRDDRRRRRRSSSRRHRR